MQLPSGCRDMILQFKLIQTYNLDFIIDKDDYVHLVVLCYQFGMSANPLHNQLVFEFINRDETIRSNTKALVLAKTEDTKFTISTRFARHFNWSHNHQNFYYYIDGNRLSLPHYLNNIIFKLITFFINNLKDQDGITALEALEQELKKQGVVTKVINNENIYSW